MDNQSPLKFIAPVNPFVMTKEQAACLTAACELDYAGRTPLDIIDMVAARKAVLWGWPGGIMVTCIEHHHEGPILFILALFGRDFFSNIGKIYEDLHEVARHFGAVKIGALCREQRFAQAMIRYGAVPRGIYCEQDVQR